ncbi:MAG: hypothetical protein WBN20_13595, partial [Eudoraea sp.]|uniref:hypothetical protein n=1 Tax=Eudoraea sp. TaxID=1979955 RepID=UPI003C73F5C9
VTLNDFNNDAGFITGADIVSPAPNNSITDNVVAFYDNTPLQNDIAANTAAIAADGDTDATNEIQNLALAGNNLTISGANTVYLGAFNNAGTDDQQLTLTGNNLIIEDGNTVDLSALNNPGTDEQDLTGATLSGANILQIDIENGASATVDLSALSGTGTDDQNLTSATLTGNTLQIDIENGTSASVDLTPLSGTGTDDQQLTLTGGNILTLEDGGTVDLNPFLDNTDDQNITNFAFDGLTNVLTITLEDGNTQTVDLTALATGAGTDDQQLTITGGNILTLEDGGTVDLNPFLDNVDTDNQNITNFVFDDLTNILTITLEDGNTQTVDLTALATAAGTDDQVAAEVPFTPTGNTLSVEVQSAIEELQTEIDGISAGGAANPTDELQNLLLNNTELSLTPPATPNFPIDLDPVFATDAELAALNVDDADADPANEIQDLNLAANTLTITNNAGATPIDLSPYLDDTDTDDQTAVQVPVAATPTNYVAATPDVEAHLTGIDLVLATAGGNPTDEIQDLNLAANTLTITNNAGATPIDLSPYLDDTDTDDQTAVQVPVAATPTNYVAATPDVEAHLTGIDVALAAGGGNPTDEIQDLNLAANTLTITNNAGATPIDLSPYLDDTDTDDQTAVQVPVAATPTNYVAATPDVEAHLTGIDV